MRAAFGFFKRGGREGVPNSTREDPQVTAQLPPDVIILVIRFPQMNWDGGWHGVRGTTSSQTLPGGSFHKTPRVEGTALPELLIGERLS